MDISIIIINYNTFALTCSCIESIIEHTHNLTYEIILVDNASIECSANLFVEKFPIIKLIKNPVNAGYTGGNNLGIQIAKGDTILLLNSDVILTENSILKCREALKNNREIGLVTCMLKYPDGSIQKQCQPLPSVLLTIIELFRLHKLIPLTKRGMLMQNGFFDHLTSIYCDSVWGTFFMFPGKILKNFENGILPGDFFMYAEDLMWCYRIKKMGYKIYYNANTSVIHYGGASSLEAGMMKYKHQNEYDFIVKYYGWFYAKILVLFRSILYASSSGKGYASEVSGIYFKLFLKGKLN